jgi:regulator of sigma E protease
MDISSISIAVVAFVAVFSVLVFVHELGHFAMARWFGIRVVTFSIGFGPPLWRRTDRHGVDWRVSAIPLGGYVKFFGDESAASNAAKGLDTLSAEERRDCLHLRPLGQRALVVAAGPAANFLLAFVIFWALFVTIGQSYTAPVVDAVLDGTPAREAGFEPNDRIVQVGGYRIQSFEEVRNHIAMNPGRALSFTVLRGDRELALEATPRTVMRHGMKAGELGIRGERREMVRRGPLEAAWHSAVEIRDNVVLILHVVGEMLAGERSVKDLGGPLKIAEISGEVAQVSLLGLVMMAAALSVNLGLINLFPIPMLDGGHLLYYAFEAVRGRPLGEKVQEYGFRMGMALVLVLMVVVTWNDLASWVSRLQS